MSTKEERAAVWMDLIAEQGASGLSQSAFCRQREISFSNFCNWRGRLKRQSAASTDWISVCANDVSVPQSSITLRIGGALIDVSPGFDAQLLREVVGALH